MQVCTTLGALQQAVTHARRAGQRIGFVPTMGNLHAGHRHLMEQARQVADTVVASIYVNPLQFGPNEDFAIYPRTPEQDIQVLNAAGVDILFMPDENQMYPRGREAQTRVEVPGVSDILCGAFRPGHFQGVTTVVNRLLNVVGADVALFGKKDYQQLLLIRLMVADLAMPVEIIGVDTVRDQDGLALSSRNGYLSVQERQIAAQVYAVLQQVQQDVTTARLPPAAAEQRASATLSTAGFRPDYISIRRRADLAEPRDADRELVALAAAYLGRTRLIDNLEIDR